MNVCRACGKSKKNLWLSASGMCEKCAWERHKEMQREEAEREYTAGRTENTQTLAMPAEMHGYGKKQAAHVDVQPMLGYKQEAPLKFHKFFWYVALPLGGAVELINYLNLIPEFAMITPSFYWIIVVQTAFLIASILLRVVCFVGFFGWKQNAWYGVMFLLAVNIAYSTYILIGDAIYTPDNITTSIGALIGSLAYSIPVAIYYIKRRWLFCY